VLDDYSRLPSVADEEIVPAPRSGHVGAIAAEAVGRAAVALGAGRARIDDVIDPAVGIRVAAHLGARVSPGDAVLVLRHRAGRGLTEALHLLEAAVRIDDEAAPAAPLVVDRVAEER
jgi:thymidine phosphorylase